MALAIALIVIATPLVLWASVLLPGTQPAVGTADPAYPRFLDGLSPGTFDRPGVCDNCHQGYKLAVEPYYEPFDTWMGSMMANASRDPLFWAALDVANQDDAAIGNVGAGDFCLRCHVPRGWYEGRSSCVTAWGEDFDGACLEGPPTMVDNDYEGLLCSFCHRMYDASTPPPGEFADASAPRVGNGQVYLRTTERDLGGPFSDAAPLSHTARGEAFFRSASLCGQCHDVTNPVLNRKDATTGADLGYLMPIERTFSEWKQSRISDATAPEAATCQQCHMPQPDLDGPGHRGCRHRCRGQRARHQPRRPQVPDGLPGRPSRLDLPGGRRGSRLERHSLRGRDHVGVMRLRSGNGRADRGSAGEDLRGQARHLQPPRHAQLRRPRRGRRADVPRPAQRGLQPDRRGWAIEPWREDARVVGGLWPLRAGRSLHLARDHCRDARAAGRMLLPRRVRRHAAGPVRSQRGHVSRRGDVLWRR